MKFSKNSTQVMADRHVQIFMFLSLRKNREQHLFFFFLLLSKTEPQASPSGGYIPVSLQTKVGM